MTVAERPRLSQDLPANLPVRSTKLRATDKVKTILTTRYLAVWLFRLSQRLGRRSSVLASVVKQLNQILTGADLAWEASVGAGLVLYHPSGVVIGPQCVLGVECKIQQGVTVGGSGAPDTGEAVPSPRIGDNVALGAGARVIGPVQIGNSARIGANAVVTKSVPAFATAVGVPATWSIKGRSDLSQRQDRQ